MYRLALERGKIDDFLTILSLPVSHTSEIVKQSPVSHSIIPHPDGVGKRVMQIETVSRQFDSLQESVKKTAQKHDYVLES